MDRKSRLTSVEYVNFDMADRSEPKERRTDGLLDYARQSPRYLFLTFQSITLFDQDEGETVPIPSSNHVAAMLNNMEGSESEKCNKDGQFSGENPAVLPTGLNAMFLT